MDPAQFRALPDFLSRDRLAPYVAATGGHVAQAIRLYTWNVEVAAAFWGPVHTVEVALRNAIHDQMRGHWGRADWWNDARVVLHATMADQVNVAGQEAPER